MPISKRSQKPLIPKDIAEILIGIFSEKTDFPIILFEEELDKPCAYEASTKYFSDFCKYLHSCGYVFNCNQDHLLRARSCEKESISLCWMGLTNASVPLFINEARRAVLLYGQVRIDDPNLLETSKTYFLKNLPTLRINDTQRKRLIENFDKIRIIDKNRIDPKILGELQTINKWFYSLIFDKLNFEQDVSRVNHELSNNLQAVIADAEVNWMMIDPSHEEYKREARELLYSAQRMSVVVNNFGKFMGEYRFEIAPLYDILESCIEIYQSLAEVKGVRITLTEKDSRPFPKVRLSVRHFQHALQNLIHNAVKYSHRGFHRPSSNPLTVDIYGSRASKGYCIEIENFGVGILPEEITFKKIFEPGYKGKLTEGEYRTGGGYGLPTAKEILDKHNSSLTVESEKVDGDVYVTKVSIFFPKIEED